MYEMPDITSTSATYISMSVHLSFSQLHALTHNIPTKDDSHLNAPDRRQLNSYIKCRPDRKDVRCLLHAMKDAIP